MSGAKTAAISGGSSDVSRKFVGMSAKYSTTFAYLNLMTNPNAEIRVGGDRLLVRAREAEGAERERERLSARLVETDPAYAEYQERTKRRLPVVALEPRVLPEAPEER